MQNTLYREEILEHYKDPQNFGKLAHCDISARQTNPFCGDDIEMFVSFSPRHPERSEGLDSSESILQRSLTNVSLKSDKLRDSSASLRMTKKASTSLSQENINDISFTGRGCAISIAGASILTEFAKGKSKDELTKMCERDMLGLLQIDVSETRKKCALLAYSVLKDCLK